MSANIYLNVRYPKFQRLPFPTFTKSSLGDKHTTGIRFMTNHGNFRAIMSSAIAQKNREISGIWSLIKGRFSLYNHPTCKDLLWSGRHLTAYNNNGIKVRRPKITTAVEKRKDFKSRNATDCRMWSYHISSPFIVLGYLADPHLV